MLITLIKLIKNRREYTLEWGVKGRRAGDNVVVGGGTAAAVALYIGAAAAVCRSVVAHAGCTTKAVRCRGAHILHQTVGGDLTAVAHDGWTCGRRGP
jgi:hypothetical protein